MKKQVLKLLSLAGLVVAGFAAQAQERFVDDIFANVLKTTNIPYDSNRSFNILFNSGYPVPSVNNSPFITANLLCDVYQPDGDTLEKRPVVIVTHTGSFLPPYVNRQSTGSKNDSAIVELCTRFAKKGYVAVAMNYRLGWRATSTVQEIATQDLLQATYRGIQDVRNCIRFLRSNAATYKIDTSKIVVGGQGTGGYIALAFGTVDKRGEIESNPKFLRGDFTPMVNMDSLGDWNGVGGIPFFNYGGDAAVSANAHMIFNYGGSMGDSTWLEANSLPMVGLHVATDPFAPYLTGDVRVPNGPTVIPSASGAGVVIPMANALGVNSKINAAFYDDPYTTAALAQSGGVKNLFPLRPTVAVDGAPWEWWNRTAVQNATGQGAGTWYVYPMPANGREADSLSFLTNPLMSAEKGRAYIDTVVNFVAPRIAVQFNLVDWVGVKEVASLSSKMNLYPNPASSLINIELPVVMETAAVLDITGREVLRSDKQTMQQTFDVSSLKQGIYFVSVKAIDGRTATKRFIVE